MSSPYYCSPPIHGASLSGKVYLVTSTQAKAPGRGVYPSWEPAQRVSEGVTRGGAVKYDSYNLSLPAWHDCCDAGEHDHPANPQSRQSAPIPAPMATPVAPVLPATPVTPRRSCPEASATPKSRAPAPAAAPQHAAVAALRYAISGTGIVYTDLTDALDHFERVATSWPTTFLTTEDSRYAAHFAGALADGERLANEVETRWDGGRPPYPTRLTDAGRRQARTACALRLCRSLRLLKGGAEDSDSELIFSLASSRAHNTYDLLPLVYFLFLPQYITLFSSKTFSKPRREFFHGIYISLSTKRQAASQQAEEIGLGAPSGVNQCVSIVGASEPHDPAGYGRGSGALWIST
ncbi:hypothetical protein C8R47DRAFT_1073764 [Mycena vitilis]|nr:hypothetical protein C8R47DRAFT_1073764 [Mycena vitilis]